MRFDSNELAVGWLSVAIASSESRDFPAMWRTVHVEQFSTGVRLVAVDGYLALRTWVPLDSDYHPEPGIDEAPLTTATVIDPDRRGAGILRHARKLWQRAIDGDDQAPSAINLDLGVVVDDDNTDGQATFPGLEPRWALLSLPGEQVKLPLYDGPFPTWRNVFGRPRRTTRTEAIALAPTMMQRLGQLGALHPPAARIGCQFTGENQPVMIQVVDGEPYVEGLAMPCLWDVELNQPVPPADHDSSTEAAA